LHKVFKFVYRSLRHLRDDKMDNNNAAATPGSAGNANTNTQPLPNQGNVNANVPPKPKGSSKTTLISGIVIVLVIIAIAAYFASSSGASVGFPSAAQVSAIYNVKFTASPAVNILASSPSLQQYSAYGLKNAELENYTNASSGYILSVGELQFASQSNASKIFSALSTLGANFTQYDGGEYLVSPTGTSALGYKNNIVLLTELTTNVGAVYNATATAVHTTKLMQLLLSNA
jgi:hypothetical protein